MEGREITLSASLPACAGTGRLTRTRRSRWRQGINGWPSWQPAGRFPACRHRPDAALHRRSAADAVRAKGLPTGMMAVADPGVIISSGHQSGASDARSRCPESFVAAGSTPARARNADHRHDSGRQVLSYRRAAERAVACVNNGQSICCPFVHPGGLSRTAVPNESPAWFHAYRAVGGNCHHRRPDRALAPAVREFVRHCPYELLQQSQAVRPRHALVSRCDGRFPICVRAVVRTATPERVILPTWSNPTFSTSISPPSPV